MARRKRNEGVLDLLIELPWWVTLVLGLICMGVSGGGGNALVTLVFKMFSYACFVAAFVGAIKSLSRKALFASAKDIEAIRAMSWREFETLVGESYRRQGYSVEETGGGGADGGIDLILRGKGQKILVQCKRWQKVQVDVMIVREMFGLLHHEKADRVIIVTIGTYTPDAVNFARGKPIELVNGKALVQLIRDVKRTTISAPAHTSVQPAQVTQMKVLDVLTAASTATEPACPKCGSPMVMRTARQGANAGNTFWGCSRYPNCRGIVSVNERDNGMSQKGCSTMAETMIVSCPHCAENMSVPADYDGLTGKCPKCRRQFVMNPASTSPTTAPRAAVAQPPAIPRPASAPSGSVKVQNLRTLIGPLAVGATFLILGLGAVVQLFSDSKKVTETTQPHTKPLFQSMPSAPAKAPAAQSLPEREVTYGDLLKALNEFGAEYKSATTTIQKKDIRLRAQKKAAAVVGNARMSIAATVRDVRENPDGNVILSFREFDAPAETVQMAMKLLSPSIGSLKVNLPREKALGIKTGQKVWITGRPNVIAQDNIILGAMSEALNPSLATFRFPLDIETLLTLRMVDYTVGLKNN